MREKNLKKNPTRNSGSRSECFSNRKSLVLLWNEGLSPRFLFFRREGWKLLRLWGGLLLLGRRAQGGGRHAGGVQKRKDDENSLRSRVKNV
jgi:hypothetical protein